MAPGAGRPGSAGGSPRKTPLPIGPLRTTDGLSIQYVDDQGVTQTLATSVYQVSLGMTGVIRPSYGNTWPSVRAQMDAVTVTFTAGEQSLDDINPAFLQAIRLHINDFYDNRGSIVVGAQASEILSLSARNLLTPFVRND